MEPSTKGNGRTILGMAEGFLRGLIIQDMKASLLPGEWEESPKEFILIALDRSVTRHGFLHALHLHTRPLHPDLKSLDT